MDAAITQDYFSEKQLDAKFPEYINMMHTFALNGEPIDGPAMLKFIMILKNKVMASESPDLLDNAVKDNLISVLWLMIYREQEMSSKSV